MNAQTDESFLSHRTPSPACSTVQRRTTSTQTGDSAISHLCVGDPSLPTCADEGLLMMATKRKTKALTGKPTTHMRKQKVVTRKRHRQRPKALLSPTDHVASGAEVKRKRYVNNPLISRCSLHIYMKDKKQINFCECHNELMRATPFAPYVDIPPMKCFGISLLEELVAHHEVGNVFNIGNKSVSFTVEDVAFILGMPCTGFPVHHWLVYRSVQANDIAFTRQVIHGYLIDLVGLDEKEDIEDTVCLWILLLLSTFLAPRSLYVYSPQMIKYLDDIERIGSYAWAIAFHELILHNIEEASKMVKMNAKRGRHDEKPRKNQFIFGCSYALCETSTPTLSINAQMAALVDALKAAEDSRKTENKDFRQKLESIMTQVEGFAKSIISLRQEKEKPADVPPLDPPCEAVEKENSEEEVKVLQKFFCSCEMQDAIEDWELKFDMDCPSQPPHSYECGIHVTMEVHVATVIPVAITRCVAFLSRPVNGS
ncbi:hypothetical protein Taro_037957 [Colocasia esculenta]|uniref:Aminotransferase-like plant mobile domain-containing protein n=1 Tax=Colocasia esculenta TaxID=4460 RepID=A0A843WM85_COLES|nr:hypothetical protein [Colocasia esculenta]